MTTGKQALKALETKAAAEGRNLYHLRSEFAEAGICGYVTRTSKHRTSAPCTLKPATDCVNGHCKRHCGDHIIECIRKECPSTQETTTYVVTPSQGHAIATSGLRFGTDYRQHSEGSRVVVAAGSAAEAIVRAAGGVRAADSRRRG